VRPDPDAEVTLPDGATLRRGMEVLTFVSRGLEPYRGFHSFMRALPGILDARPDCQVVIVGGLDVHYGPRPSQFPNWKTQYLSELEGQLDLLTSRASTSPARCPTATTSRCCRYRACTCT
jgi:hypothetical protein